MKVSEVSEVQSSKEFSRIVVTEPGSTKVESDPQPEKAFWEIVLRFEPAPKERSLRATHPLKAADSMVVRLLWSSKDIEEREVQPLKAPLLTDCTDGGIEREGRPEQP